MSRHIQTIVVHGAWTKPDLDVGVEEIRRWHLAKGWRDIGYHYVIRRNGDTEAGRPVEQAGAHVAGHNADTLGICLVGGREAVTPVQHMEGLDDMARQELLWEFNYTRRQMEALNRLVDRLRTGTLPDVRGHRDFPGVGKRCPGFDVQEYFK